MATLTTLLTIGLEINQDWPFLLVLLVAFGAGLVGGVAQRFLVVRLRVNTFIATLGTGGVFARPLLGLRRGTQISPVAGGPKLPSWFCGTGLVRHASRPRSPSR